MKFKIKFFLAFYALFLAAGTISCDNCGKGLSGTTEFQVTELVWQTKKISYEVPGTTANSVLLSDIDGKPVKFNEFAIKIEPQKKQVVLMNNVKTTAGLLPSAFACDLVMPRKTLNKIERFTISSNSEFSGVSAGTNDLAKFFNVIVNDFDKGIFSVVYDLTSYIDSKPTVPSNMTLVLKSTPMTTAKYAFTVNLTESGSDVKTLNFTTTPVEITAK